MASGLDQNDEETSRWENCWIIRFVLDISKPKIPIEIDERSETVHAWFETIQWRRTKSQIENEISIERIVITIVVVEEEYEE